MSDEQLKSYLQKRLGGYSHPVDDSLWESVINDVSAKKRKKKISMLIISSLSAASIILAVVFLLNPREQENACIAVNIERVTNRELVDEVKTSSLSFHISEEGASFGTYAKIKSSSSPVPAIRDAIDTLAQPAQKEEHYEGTIKVVPEELADTTSSTPRLDNTAKYASADNHKKNTNTYSLFYDDVPELKKNRKNDLSFLLAVNGIGGGSSTTASDMLVYDNKGGSFLGDDSYENKLVMSDPTYDFPLSFALTVRKKVADRLSLESGLVYTYLRTSDSGKDITIKLHYLGIPLKAVYTVYDGGLLSLYGSAGGVGEMQISGSMDNRKGSHSISNTNPQWSVVASAGVELKLGKYAGLFLEPGVVYFFDDGSNIPTIRKDKPLSFNVQAGLRFNIN